MFFLTTTFYIHSNKSDRIKRSNVIELNELFTTKTKIKIENSKIKIAEIKEILSEFFLSFFDFEDRLEMMAFILKPYKK